MGTKEKIFKSVKGLQRNFRKCILKNRQLFAKISKLRPKQKNARGKSWSPRGLILPLKMFYLKGEHPV